MCVYTYNPIYDMQEIYKAQVLVYIPLETGPKPRIYLRNAEELTGV